MELHFRYLRRKQVIGKIYVIGIGPGNKENMTFRAYNSMKKSDVIIGHKTYVSLVEKMFEKLTGRDGGSGDMDDDGALRSILSHPELEGMGEETKFVEQHLMGKYDLGSAGN